MGFPKVEKASQRIEVFAGVLTEAQEGGEKKEEHAKKQRLQNFRGF